MDPDKIKKEMIKIEAGKFNVKFNAIENVEFTGIKSASGIQQKLNNITYSLTSKIMEKLKTYSFKITVGDKSQVIALKDLDVDTSCYVNRFLVYKIRDQLKPLLLRSTRKDGTPVTWVPRWGSAAWRVLNRAHIHNQKPIIRIIEPQGLLLTSTLAFIPDSYTLSKGLTSLVANDYVTVTSDNARIKAKRLSNDGTIRDEDLKGQLVEITEKGETFYEKNIKKQFRMINHISGDVYEDLEDLNGDVFPYAFGY